MHSEADIAYLAGLADGEGTLSAHVAYQDSHRSVSIRVSISSTDPMILVWLRDTFGGVIHSPNKPRSVKHKPISMWYVGSNRAVGLCRMLRPYLRIKKRHAEILIALSELRYVYGARGRVVPPEVDAARSPLLTELRSLNYRGVKSA